MDPTSVEQKPTNSDPETAIREKIDDLMATSRENYISDPQKAKVDVEKAYALAKSIEYEYGLGECLRVLGNIAWVQGNAEIAVGNYRGARAVFEKLGDN